MEEVFPLHGRCFTKLVQLGPVQERIINPKAKNIFFDAFAAMVANPKKLTEGQFKPL